MVADDGRLEVHVVPIGDLREHSARRDCWCRPTRDEEEPRVLVHHALDQRGLFETGQRQLS